ncbi:MAG TPA: metal-dependent hydrolase, partial [Puia sp.]|nr:metal-dependent hydrolase [Puia sp.]
MDSLTHIVLGAIIGEAVAGRRLGKKAMLLGAVAQSIPDIDFVASSWLDTSRDVLAHRGITHSFLFVALMGTALAFLARRLERRGSAERDGVQMGTERDAGAGGSDAGQTREGGLDTDRSGGQLDAGAEGSGRRVGGLTLRGWLF